MKILFGVILVSQANGHGYISNPPAQFKDSTSKTRFNALIDENIDPAFSGLKWNGSPDNNLNTFTNSFNKSKFTSLKNMFDTANVDCGNSRTDVANVDVSMMNSMSWQNDEYKEGFINSHSGPCEVWIDNERVFNNNDCRSAYTDYPAMLPIKYDSCKGKCLLQFYWCAVHEPKWQLYKQCVPIVYEKKGTTSSSVGKSIEYQVSVEGETCSCKIV